MQLYTALLVLLGEIHLILASACLCGVLPSYHQSRDNLANLDHKYADRLIVELHTSLLVNPDHGDLRCSLGKVCFLSPRFQ